MKTEKRKEDKKSSNGESDALAKELASAPWLAELCKGVKTEAEAFGPDGLFQTLKRAMMEKMLEAELTAHLGYEKHERTGPSENARNGTSSKTVETESGSMTLSVPRDRQSSFEPLLLPKHRRRLAGFDEKVIALYSRGVSTREIAAHLEEIYGARVSQELISTVTDAVLEEARAWGQRPLDGIYPIVYLDALFVSIREQSVVKKRAVYVAIGVNMDGTREVLGLWICQTEGAKFWLSVLTDLKQRGVQDIFFVCCDGLSGFPEAIEAAFPHAVVQTCIVHLMRAALRYVGEADKRAVVKALRAVYSAADEAAASVALDAFDAEYGGRYPTITKSWREHWAQIVPFLAYPPEVRTMIYTTNPIESLNFQLRRVLKTKGLFPSDDAVTKLLFLAIRNAKKNWKPNRYWKMALAHFAIMFQDRMPA